MNTPVFSICVPVYNVEKYLEHCVRSVLDQTFSDYEVLLVDDGSPDNSGLICDQLAQSDSRIKVFHKPNEGLMATRAFAVSKASGQYIIHLDSDDYLANNALETILTYINLHQADCIIYQWERVFEGKKIDDLSIQSIIDEPQVLCSHHDMFNLILGSPGYNSLCIKCFKKSVYDGVDFSNFYNISIAEDLLQTIHLIVGCKKIVVIPDVLYKYTDNPTSMTNSIDWNKEEISFLVREQVLDLMQRYANYNDTEIIKHRTSSVLFLIDTVLSIIQSDASYKRKKTLFQNIHSSTYYQTFLCGKIDKKRISFSKRIIFKLFKCKMYWVILLLSRCYKLFKKGSLKTQTRS